MMTTINMIPINIAFFGSAIVMVAAQRFPKIAEPAAIFGLVCGAFIFVRWAMNPYTFIFS
jgi:hypothetical protein